MADFILYLLREKERGVPLSLGAGHEAARHGYYGEHRGNVQGLEDTEADVSFGVTKWDMSLVLRHWLGPSYEPVFDVFT